jgi:hypothetical protein
MKSINEILIIGVDFSENGDTGVITVGRQTNGKVDIINVFRGKDAEELYSKLEGQKTHNIKEESSMSSWAEKEVEIACKHERGNTPDEWDYGCACYESALKAYKSLIEDGHSGFSIGLTKHILNRLIDGKPLTPIEDTDDVWSDISDISGLNGEVVNYQCKRMSSLFKYVYADGTVEYKDLNRYNRYYCVDINNTEVTYYNSLVQRIIDEMFPITMPYFPGKPIKVYCEDFLTDRKNGDFDTVGIFYAIKPDGEKVEINRFFKENGNDWVEITIEEYKQRKDIELKRLQEETPEFMKKEFYISNPR